MLRWILVASLTTAATAQPVEETGRKRLLCAQNTKQLIGLTRDQLRERCGIWSHINSDVNASGQREQAIYDKKTGPRFYVYLSNGRVRTVHKR